MPVLLCFTGFWHSALVIPIVCSVLPDPSPGCSTSLLLDRTLIRRSFWGISFLGGGLSFYGTLVHAWITFSLPDLGSLGLCSVCVSDCVAGR